MLAKYHLTSDDPKRALTAVIITYDLSAPLRGLDLRGFLSASRRSSRKRRWWTARAVWARSSDLAALVAPGLVATSVFVVITAWNEYIFANVLLTNQSNHTLTVWLSYFTGSSRNTDWGGLMAASTLTAIPVVIFFLLVQRRIAFGLTAGAVKG